MSTFCSAIIALSLASLASLASAAGGEGRAPRGPKLSGPFGINHADFAHQFHEENLRSDGRLTSIHFGTPLSTLSTMQATPQQYNNGDDITVSWNGIQCTGSDDWIGVYAPGLYDTLGDASEGYLDWSYLSEVSPNYKSGSGSMIFSKVMNLRTPLVFQYYSKNATCKGGSSWSLVAATGDVPPVDANEPTEAHIALGDVSSEMVLTFITNSPDVPVVYFGKSASELNNKAVGTTQTYSADMMCEGIAILTSSPYFAKPGYMHRVKMTHLSPSSVYYYSYGVVSMSPVKTFRTGPEDGSKDTTVRIAAFGDQGSYQTGTAATVSRLNEHLSELDLILAIGDLSYAWGYGVYWDVLGNIIEPHASNIPYMISIGNHEFDYMTGGENDPSGYPAFHPIWGNYGSDSGGECAVPPFHRFTAPVGPLSNAIFWYSFPFGSAYILQMSSEHDYSEGSPQYTWMEATLKSIDREIFPWVILTTHRPMYTSENYQSDKTVAHNMQRLFEPLLLQYKVDVVLAGHYHSYERTCAVNRNECVDLSKEHGIYHVVIGMAGMSLDSASFTPEKWSIFHDQVFGYSTLEVNSTALVFKYFHDEDDRLIDSFSIAKF